LICNAETLADTWISSGQRVSCSQTLLSTHNERLERLPGDGPALVDRQMPQRLDEWLLPVPLGPHTQSTSARSIPVGLDCHFESICESCVYFQTTLEFRPTLQRQRDDAAEKGRVARLKIFDGLLQRLDSQAQARAS
jgi:hypothetical protein